MHRQAATVAAIGLLTVGLIASAPQGAGAAPTGSTPASTSTATGASTPGSEVANLRSRVDTLDERTTWVLLPVTALLAILSLGGALGVVFSIRDQRRVSQLHELTVSAEVGSQRRTSETYATYLEASQKTLTLVNDTLALAKDASERATQALERKADSNLASIERDAQDLLVYQFEQADFKKLVEDPRVRGRLESIAAELRAIEGFLVLQDITLGPYCLFIKGMDEHLQHRTNDALITLRRAAQDRSLRDLRRFALYWVGYLQNNEGHYSEAEHDFTAAREHLEEDSPAKPELDRILFESEFFRIASHKPKATPRERLEAVSPVFERLSGLRDVLLERDERGSLSRVTRMVLGTLANILTWIAYDVEHEFRRLAPCDLKAHERMHPALNVLIRAADAPATDDEKELRIFCWRLARILFEAQGTPTALFTLFGLLECDFYLGGKVDAERVNLLEREVGREQRARTEPRNTANLAQTLLVARGRLAAVTQERSHAAVMVDAYREVQQGLRQVESGTVFSQLQKRNIDHEEFGDEVERYERDALKAAKQDQTGLTPTKKAPPENVVTDDE